MLRIAFALLLTVHVSTFAADPPSGGEIRSGTEARVETPRRSRWIPGCLGLLVAGALAVGGYLEWSFGAFDGTSKDALEHVLHEKKVPAPAELRVHVVGTKHWHPRIEEGVAPTLDDVVASQMSLLQHLRARLRAGRTLHVFLEGGVFVYEPALRRDPRFADIHAAFPEGFPEPDKDGVTRLTEAQKKAFAYHSAPIVLWATGEIPLLYPTSTEAVQQRGREFRARKDRGGLWPHEKREYMLFMFRQREILAFEQILKYFPQGTPPGSDIVLPFGEMHDFDQYKGVWLHIARYR